MDMRIARVRGVMGGVGLDDIVVVEAEARRYVQRWIYNMRARIQ